MYLKIVFNLIFLLDNTIQFFPIYLFFFEWRFSLVAFLLSPSSSLSLAITELSACIALALVCTLSSVIL